MKQLLLIPLLLLLAMTTMAQGFGNFASAVFFQKNGQFDIYNITGSGPNIIGPGGPDFTGNLGTFDQNSGQLILKGAEVKTYKDANGNVCGSDFYYNIHPQGTPGGTYTDMNLPYKAGCSNGVFTDGLGPCSGNDQKWNKETANEDLTNRCPGTYVMDVYYKTPGSGSSTSGCNENVDIGSASSPAGTMTFTIAGTPLNAAINAGTPTCQGIPVNLTPNVTGGSSPYTYSWSGPNGFSSMAASPSVTTPGTYSLTVTDHCGVTTTVQTTVTFKPTPMPPSVTASATACPAGTATLMANGCNGMVTWSNGMTGASITAAAGTYTATCTVDGCTSTASSSVTVSPCPPPCAPPTICVGPTACPSGLATLTASGCNGTVTWSNGMMGSSIVVPPGTYTATCTVNGITSTSSAPATVAPCPSNNPCPPYPPAPPPPCSSTGNLLINGSFETSTNAYYAVSNQTGWTNEGPGNSGYLEVWKSGVEGVAAPAGNQLVEMNYLTLGIITQRVAVKKNVPINLSYYHRSRNAAGGEKMRVDIMDMTTNTIIHSYESTSIASWKKFKTVFVPTSNDIQVRLVSENTCNGGTADAGCGNLLDNVVMNYTACQCTAVPDAPVICAPVTDLCSNGSVTITAQGCAGGTIKWSNGQTGPTLTTNVPGTYTAQCIMPGITCESAPSNSATLLGCTDVSVSCPTFEWKTNGVYHIKFCVKNNGYTPASGTAYYKINGVVVYSEPYTNLAPGAENQ